MTSQAVLVEIPGGTFTMGSDRHYPEERPAHEVSVAPFRMGTCTVTNREFAAFAEATGYITVAERDLGDAPPGSLVFRRPDHPVDLSNPAEWWAYEPGASWRNVDGGPDHPVVHVAHEDAVAYAAWAGRALPTEAEWERAARGGLEGATFPWGEDLLPEGRLAANVWLGEFPTEFARPGRPGPEPVGSYPPNGYGLHDVTGNVWEWTADPWRPRHDAPSVDGAYTIKGGSFLCAASYCARYRPAARSGQDALTSTSHLGFRCVSRGAS